MKKRLLSLLLGGVLLLSLAACSNQAGSAAQETGAEESTENTAKDADVSAMSFDEMKEAAKGPEVTC